MLCLCVFFVLQCVNSHGFFFDCSCELVPCVTMSPLDWYYKYSIQHGDVIIFFFASASQPIYAALNSRFLESQLWVLGVTLC